MNPQARQRYLVDQVMTAPPQKLHLMLIEGAIRFIRKAQRHWAAKEDEQAAGALIRAQEIVGEILSGFKRDLDPDLVHRVAAVYAFILRSLVEGCTLHDERKLADALRILEIERETWRQLCEQIGAQRPALPLHGPSPAAPIPPAVFDVLPAGAQPGGFSLEA